MIVYDNKNQSATEPVDVEDNAAQESSFKIGLFAAICIILCLGIFFSIRLLRGHSETQPVVNDTPSEELNVETVDSSIRDGRFHADDVTRDRYNVDPASRYELDVDDTTLMHLMLTSFTARARYVKGSDAWQFRLYGMCKNIGQVDSDWRGLPKIKIANKKATLELTDGFIRTGASHEWSAVVTIPASELGDKITVKIGSAKGSASFSSLPDIDIAQMCSIPDDITDDVCKQMAEGLVVARACHEFDSQIADQVGTTDDYTLIDDHIVIDGNKVKVVGSIRNNRSETSESVIVSVVFFDKNKQVVDYGTWSTDKLDSGEIADFEIKPTNGAKGIVSYAYGDIFV